MGIVVIILCVIVGIIGFEVFRISGIINVMQYVVMFISDDQTTVMLSKNKGNIENITAKLKGDENDVH